MYFSETKDIDESRETREHFDQKQNEGKEKEKNQEEIQLLSFGLGKIKYNENTLNNLSCFLFTHPSPPHHLHPGQKHHKQIGEISPTKVVKLKKKTKNPATDPKK